ncbi:OstA-like protein [Marinitoga hydrogenitolerans DSM 16785]|uniref:OstA-like protein n=1 Tax=Marinitoga hydrogenitolerans (strain DSM 16785 / JCM 12826 / AT1271) TaxID=1122195 RepID=A0A1M4W9W5_MARH1|nr:LptA/OstA family protein [Marinitoga hydrogenitolerans]SHE78061.1 OstA-like protein [Marinitoga hydrogenitolerans DSM 16785]
MKKIILLFFIIFTIVSFSSTIHVSADTVKGGDDFYVLKNNVQVIKDTLNVLTNLATVTLVNDEWRKLEAEGGIKIKTDTMEATSSNLNYDLKNDIGILKGSVETKITLKKEKKDIYIFCDIINFDNKNKTYSGKMLDENALVKIIKEDYIIFAKSFEYDENTKILILKDNVKIKNDKKKINMDTSQATFKTDKNEISAEKVKLTLEIENKEENK